MPRQFYIQEGESGDCVVKDGEQGTPFQFMNLLEAMAFVHRHRGEDTLEVCYFNASGDRVFTKTIGPG